MAGAGSALLNTFTSYTLIARDLGKALDRVEKQPVVDRDTKYYLENITKVKTIDEFVKNDRLFSYAMKAHGLADMTYAKAFMVKALKEGITDEDSFANKLSDRRYRDFVASYNFAQRGELATTYNQAQVEVPKNYAIQATIAGVDPTSAFVKNETAYYNANVTKLKSIDDLMGNARLLTYAMAAYGLDDTTANKDKIRQSLEDGVSDSDSYVNKLDDNRYVAFATAFDFKGKGAEVTTLSNAQQPAVDKYIRQKLEEDAGEQNEGVRLALYFERKAPTITSFYEVLGDTALAKVVRTMLSLPESFAAADIDKQVKLFESKIDIADFSDPEKLGKLMTRFTSLWEVANPTETAQSSLSVLFTQADYGVSANTLFAINSLKR